MSIIKFLSSFIQGYFILQRKCRAFTEGLCQKHLSNFAKSIDPMNPKRPLIFVPGIRTSTLAIKKDDGHLEHFWPLMPHEFVVRDKLDRTFQFLDTKIRQKAEDDDVPVVATGLIPMAYDGLIRSILIWGYKPNVDFWIFPYDWRQSNSVSGQQLSRFIEEKIEGRRWDDGVDIVNHSMGGIITRSAYRYGAPIKRSVYVACPHFGSPLAYFILHPEINSQQFIGSFHMPQVPLAGSRLNRFSSAARIGGSEKTLYQRRKEIFVKFPSIYELLPDESYLSSKPILFADNRPTFGADNTYLKNDWAFKAQDMQANVRRAMEFKKDLGKELPGNKDHDILLICGTDKITCDTIGYQTHYQASTKIHSKATIVMQSGFSTPYDSGQHGDGYVPIMSAKASMTESPGCDNSAFIPRSHTFLLNDKTAIEAIGRFLAV